MSSVTSRAEQALLGAMLAGQHLEAAELRTVLAQLRAEDFGQRVHQRLYTAITELSAGEPGEPGQHGLRGDRLIDAVANRLQAIGADAGRLRDLRRAAPSPQHAAAYARLIQASGFRRQITAHAERIATAADAGTGLTHQPASRINGSANHTTKSGSATVDHQARLAAALARQAQVYTALTETTSAEWPGSEGAEPRRDEGSRAPAGEPRPTRGAMEDELLADLLRNPEQVLTLARFLPSDTFTSAQRREVYEVILTTAAAGDPIDEVIIAWQLALQRALTRLRADPTPSGDAAAAPEGQAASDPTPGEPDAVYLTRLANNITVTATAIETGHRLLADDLGTHLAAARTRADARATQPAAASDQARHVQPGHAPQHLQVEPDAPAMPQHQPPPAPPHPSPRPRP